MQGSAEGRTDLSVEESCWHQKESWIIVSAFSHFVRSMHFPTAVFLLHLDYEVNLYETYETMTHLRNLGVFCIYIFEQDVAVYQIFFWLK